MRKIIAFLLLFTVVLSLPVYADEIDSAFKDYAQGENLRYTIEDLKVGNDHERILITTDVDYPDDPDLIMWGYPIRLYRYEKGKVINFSGLLKQAVSSGPWYLEYDVLYTASRRGGFLRLDNM